MAPKKAATSKTTATKGAKSAKAPASHPAYKDMIKEAIVQLKERNGSSRQAIKKYIQANYNISAPNFESLFNTALRRGVQNEEFVQPKGPSGTVKINKKPSASKKAVKEETDKPKVEKKAAATTKKATTTTTKKTATKKAPAKATATKKAPAKKTATTKAKAPAPKTAKAKVTKAPAKTTKRGARATKAK